MCHIYIYTNINPKRPITLHHHYIFSTFLQIKTFAFLHCNLFSAVCRKHFVKWEREIREYPHKNEAYKKFKKSFFLWLRLVWRKKKSFEEILSGNGSSKDETLRGKTLLNAICFHDISLCWNYFYTKGVWILTKP